MKIRDIHIDGFGMFEDYSLTGLRPGINLLVGDNETGKSTLMKFIRYTLFGYPTGPGSLSRRMPPFRGGTHGGRITVEVNGEPFVFERKATANEGDLQVTRLTTDEPIVSPAASLLGNASRDLFENVYAFSLEELVGLDSLKSSGVEDRIFSIGMGLGRRSIGEISASLESSADRIYKASGRVHAVSEILKEIARLDEEIAAIQAKLPEYKGLADEIGDMEASIADSDEEIARLRVKAKAVEQLLQCHESYVRIARAREELAALPDPEDLPDDIEARFRGLTSDLDEKSERLREIEEGTPESESIGRLHERARSYRLNDELLEQAGGAAYLRENLNAYLQAVDQRRSDVEEIRGITEKVARGLAAISADWTEEDLESFSEEMVHIDRLEHFAEKFRDIGETRRRLEAERDIEESRAARFDPRVALLIAAALFAVGSVPFFYYGYTVAGIAFAAAAAVVLIGSFFINSRTRPPSAAEKLESLSRVRDEPLRTEYAAYMWDELRLSADLSPAKALEAIKDASAMRDQLDRRRGLSERVAERWEPAIRGFEEEAARLLAVARIASGPDAAASARAVIEAFDAEREKLAEFEYLSEHLAELELTASSLRKEIAEIEDELTVLLMVTGAEDQKDFERRVAENRKVLELREKIAAARGSIADIAGPDFVNEVLEVLAGTEKATLELEAESAARTIEALDAAVGESRKVLGRMSQRMADIEGESDLTELQMDRETELNRLQAAYEEWLADRVALKLLERVKSEYERDKQPAVIRNSGRHFSAITGGNYERVSVSLEDGTVAVYDERQAAKTIEQLSRGTKEQLLISLRLGFIEEYERDAEALPLIVDDVFVNFDDLRAAEAARVFWDFARGPSDGRGAVAPFADAVHDPSAGYFGQEAPHGSEGDPGFAGSTFSGFGGDDPPFGREQGSEGSWGEGGGAGVSRGREPHTGSIAQPREFARQILIFTCHPRTRDFFGDRDVNLLKV